MNSLAAVLILKASLLEEFYIWSDRNKEMCSLMFASQSYLTDL